MFGGMKKKKERKKNYFWDDQYLLHAVRVTCGGGEAGFG